MWSNSIQSNRIKSWKKNKSSFTIFLRVCVCIENFTINSHFIQLNAIFSILGVVIVLLSFCVSTKESYCFTHQHTHTHTHANFYYSWWWWLWLWACVYILCNWFFLLSLSFFFPSFFFVFWLVFYCNIQNKCSFGSHP